MCLHRSSGPLVRLVNTGVSLRSAMAVQSDDVFEMLCFLTSHVLRFGCEIGYVGRVFELMLIAGNVHGFGDHFG